MFCISWLWHEFTKLYDFRTWTLAFNVLLQARFSNSATICSSSTYEQWWQDVWMDIVNGAAVRQLKVQQETKMSRIGILPKACYHELRPSVTKMVRLCLNKKIWNPMHIILRTECNREFKGSVWNLWKKGHFWRCVTQKYVKITPFSEKRALFCQILQRAAFRTLISSGLFPGWSEEYDTDVHEQEIIQNEVGNEATFLLVANSSFGDRLNLIERFFWKFVKVDMMHEIYK